MMKTLRPNWLLLLAVCLASGIAWADDDDDMPRIISVSGEGTTYQRPDEASIQVGVVTQADMADQALKANSEAMQKLMDALDRLDVAERDIQTTDFRVQPMYAQNRPPRGARGDEPQKPEIVGYQVHNMVQVRVRKLDKLGTILDQVVTEGANQVHGINLSLSDDKRAKVLDEARRDAVKDARRKAQLYAEAASVQLGAVRQIQEQGFQIPQPYQMEVGRAMAMQASVPIASGEQQFQVSVNITFAIGGKE